MYPLLCAHADFDIVAFLCMQTVILSLKVTSQSAGNMQSFMCKKTARSAVLLLPSITSLWELCLLLACSIHFSLLVLISQSFSQLVKVTSVTSMHIAL